ncbi:sigma factor G inhibitor Gin [Gracilibacillus alcaliphilus]|uniref:sigma factor G inhibitor Gin n=1 Tax=Gracilibacillus alcaliphilus TaxID=1401441 RepID=UPI00195ED1BA|nr:sigma factor G inhibitor Gin [Gracilibacillus alcaliphilus]MBM7678084.1 DNA-directed RNA polymerase subunit RPC12/RpoP [Gracilibacillus alcaliphilus]
MNHHKTHYRCGVCDQRKSNGIFLYQMYLCQECEQEILAIHPHDDHYQFYVKKLRAINQSTHTI